MAILDLVNVILKPHKRGPGPKAGWPGKAVADVRPIRAKLEIEGRTRHPAMFNLAIGSKLRGCNRRMNGRFAPKAALRAATARGNVSSTTTIFFWLNDTSRTQQMVRPDAGSPRL